jgi:PAS domain S-box-containing protein
MQPHDILLLMASLIPVEDPRQVTRIFVEALSGAFAPGRLQFTQEPPEGSEVTNIALKTLKGNYGTIVVDGPVQPSQTDLGLLKTACRLLSIVLENLDQRQRLKQHRDVLWERSVDPIIVVDPRTGRLLDVNRAAEKITGRSADELRGMTCDALCARGNVEHVRELLAISAEGDGREVTSECVLQRADGSRVPIEIRACTELIGARNLLIAVLRDLTERKQAEEAIRKRFVALTRPFNDAGDIHFEELFNLDDIQRLADEFSLATGVASIITHTDGTPITAPSNFSRLCADLFHQTERGLANCYATRAALGCCHSEIPVIQECMCGGLWGAGAAISVGGKHVANWLIGQVRNGVYSKDDVRNFAREIGVDENEAVAAYLELPSMSRERFGQIAQVLFTIANQLSDIAYQNVQQARAIAEREKVEEELQKHREELEEIVRERTAKLSALTAEQQLILDSVRAMIWYTDRQGSIVRANKAAVEMMGTTVGELAGTPMADIFPRAADRDCQDHRATIESGQPSLGVVEPVRLPSGEQLSVLSDRIPIVDDAGVVSGVIIFAIDITKRIQDEQKLEKRSEELRTIVKSMVGREKRMVELKQVIRRLEEQLESAGLVPIAQDPLGSGSI